jgi:hypothetical protein
MQKGKLRSLVKSRNGWGDKFWEQSETFEFLPKSMGKLQSKSTLPTPNIFQAMTSADTQTILTGFFAFFVGGILYFRMLKRQEKSEG